MSMSLSIVYFEAENPVGSTHRLHDQVYLVPSRNVNPWQLVQNGFSHASAGASEGYHVTNAAQVLQDLGSSCQYVTNCTSEPDATFVPQENGSAIMFSTHRSENYPRHVRQIFLQVTALIYYSRGR